MAVRFFFCIQAQCNAAQAVRGTGGGFLSTGCSTSPFWRNVGKEVSASRCGQDILERLEEGVVHFSTFRHFEKCLQYLCIFGETSTTPFKVRVLRGSLRHGVRECVHGGAAREIRGLRARRGQRASMKRTVLGGETRDWTRARLAP